VGSAKYYFTMCPMKRRWFWGGATLFAVAIFLATTIGLGPRNDGLDWVRQFDATESRKRYTSPPGPFRGYYRPDSRWEIHEFRFTRIPDEILHQIPRTPGRYEAADGSTVSPGGYMTNVFDFNKQTVTFLRTYKANWIDRQITGLRHLGFGDSTSPRNWTSE
jgi:hypothetical protein